MFNFVEFWNQDSGAGIAFHKNLYTVIARSEATKQSQQGSQTTPRDCFAKARNDNFLMKRYTSFESLLTLLLFKYDLASLFLIKMSVK